MVTSAQLKSFISRSYLMAKNHGFHDIELSVEHMMMLVLSEVGEAIEADRKSRRANLVMFEREVNSSQPPECESSHRMFCFERFIKDTLEDELSDVCIRLFDMCGALGLDIPYLSDEDYRDMYNEFKFSFGSKSFCERCFFLCAILCDSTSSSVIDVIGAALVFLFAMCDDMGIDLVRHISLKMDYNESRPLRHGKRY